MLGKIWRGVVEDGLSHEEATEWLSEAYQKAMSRDEYFPDWDCKQQLDGAVEDLKERLEIREDTIAQPGQNAPRWFDPIDSLDISYDCESSEEEDADQQEGQGSAWRTESGTYRPQEGMPACASGDSRSYPNASTSRPEYPSINPAEFYSPPGPATSYVPLGPPQWLGTRTMVDPSGTYEQYAYGPRWHGEGGTSTFPDAYGQRW